MIGLEAMNQKVRDFKWWVKINNASEFERALFMLQVFGLTAFERLEGIPDEMKRYNPRWDGIGRVNHDGHDAVAMNRFAMNLHFNTDEVEVFEDVDSLYSKLQELADDQVDS